MGNVSENKANIAKLLEKEEKEVTDIPSSGWADRDPGRALPGLSLPPFQKAARQLPEAAV